MAVDTEAKVDAKLATEEANTLEAKEDLKETVKAPRKKSNWLSWAWQKPDENWFDAYLVPMEYLFVEPSQKFWFNWAIRNNRLAERSSNPFFIKFPKIEPYMLPEDWDRMQKTLYPLDYFMWVGPQSVIIRQMRRPKDNKYPGLT